MIEICGYCLEPCIDVNEEKDENITTSLFCGHPCHARCLAEAVRMHGLAGCPLCRRPLHDTDITAAHASHLPPREPDALQAQRDASFRQFNAGFQSRAHAAEQPRNVGFTVLIEESAYYSMSSTMLDMLLRGAGDFWVADRDGRILFGVERRAGTDLFPSTTQSSVEGLRQVDDHEEEQQEEDGEEGTAASSIGPDYRQQQASAKKREQTRLRNFLRSRQRHRRQLADRERLHKRERHRGCQA
jgi:hypothetical protein